MGGGRGKLATDNGKDALRCDLRTSDPRDLA